MRSLVGTAVVMMVGAASALAQTRPTAAPPFFFNDTATTEIYTSAADLAAVLKKATISAGGTSSSSVTSNDQYRVSLVHRDKAAGALAHPCNTELLYIVEGAGSVITGGTLVPAADGKPASIVNGVTQKIGVGDVVIVPAGSAHWFAVVDVPITYLEVRWVAPGPR